MIRGGVSWNLYTLRLSQGRDIFTRCCFFFFSLELAQRNNGRIEAVQGPMWANRKVARCPDPRWWCPGWSWTGGLGRESALPSSSRSWFGFYQRAVRCVAWISQSCAQCWSYSAVTFFTDVVTLQPAGWDFGFDGGSHSGVRNVSVEPFHPGLFGFVIVR